jgi:hypothetical protein
MIYKKNDEIWLRGVSDLETRMDDFVRKYVMEEWLAVTRLGLTQSSFLQKNQCCKMFFLYL